MRLGGPLFGKVEDPDCWAEQVRAAGYRAAFCPVKPDATDDQVKAYKQAARRADIVIAEVGTWSSPLSPDPTARAAALEQCRQGLLLADRIGARCCVNVAGSRGTRWAGPCADDLAKETFEMVVECVRSIIDTVNPTRSFYTLETMPWMLPNSADSYLELMRAVDRRHFAVHFDPVNLLCSPELYFRNGDVIRDFVARLGPHIKSCHAKDIALQETLTVHLAEVRPGRGALDYHVYLRELEALDNEMCLMLEHLPGEKDYRDAAHYLRAIAEEEEVGL